MTAPRWFDAVMRDGLARMLLLTIPGRPAEDFAAEAFDQWVDDLFPGRDWNQATDEARIAEAFRRLRVTCEQWPTPKQFLATLDRIEKPKPKNALPPPAVKGSNLAADRCFAEVGELLRLTNSEARRDHPIEQDKPE